MKIRIWDGNSMYIVNNIYMTYSTDNVIKLVFGTAFIECTVCDITWDYKLMQCSGLTDTNMKWVFEGDRVKDVSGNSGVVELNNGRFVMKTDQGYKPLCDGLITVCGNIYEK